MFTIWFRVYLFVCLLVGVSWNVNTLLLLYLGYQEHCPVILFLIPIHSLMPGILLCLHSLCLGVSFFGGSTAIYLVYGNRALLLPPFFLSLCTPYEGSVPRWVGFNE